MFAGDIEAGSSHDPIDRDVSVLYRFIVLNTFNEEREHIVAMWIIENDRW